MSSRVTYRTADGRLSIEFDSNNDKDTFRKIAHFQEVFEDTPSGSPGGKPHTGGTVVLRVRRATYEDEKGKQKEAEYFEKVVVDGPLAWYKKSYGVLDDGSDNLFPKRPAKDDTTVEHGVNGWHKYIVNKDAR